MGYLTVTVAHYSLELNTSAILHHSTIKANQDFG